MDEKLYCHFCGYELIPSDISLTHGSSGALILGGSINTPYGGFSTPSYTKTKTNSITIKREGNRCDKCLNLTYVDLNTKYEPEEIIIDTSTKIIIPYKLKLHLAMIHSIGEKIDDFYEWLITHKERLSEFLKCYVKNNSVNPCSKKGVGFELTLTYYKSELIMNFHILIDTTITICLYRMVFQSGKIECPK